MASLCGWCGAIDWESAVQGALEHGFDLSVALHPLAVHDLQSWLEFVDASWSWLVLVGARFAVGWEGVFLRRARGERHFLRRFAAWLRRSQPAPISLAAIPRCAKCGSGRDPLAVMPWAGMCWPRSADRYARGPAIRGRDVPGREVSGRELPGRNPVGRDAGGCDVPGCDAHGCGVLGRDVRGCGALGVMRVGAVSPAVSRSAASRSAAMRTSAMRVAAMSLAAVLWV